jgi:hypothetical protein
MLSSEHRVTLCEAAKRTPGRPDASTLWRWCRKGHRGVRLEYLRFGRRIFTSIEALDRFAAAVAAMDAPIKDVEGSSAPGHLQAQSAARDRRSSPSDEPKRFFEKSTV